MKCKEHLNYNCSAVFLCLIVYYKILVLKVNPEVKPVTNQKSSGRCWIFALLNAIRQKFVQSKNIDSFEFSQTHLFFWDKIERANYNLDIYEEAARTEEPDSRTMMFLMTDPSNDGGQWDMLVNLITKYGLIPKSAWPDPHSSTSSRRMNSIIKTKVTFEEFL